jgi:hypothetical protein
MARMADARSWNESCMAGKEAVDGFRPRGVLHDPAPECPPQMWAMTSRTSIAPNVAPGGGGA